jgi:hypothetical protein
VPSLTDSGFEDLLSDKSFCKLNISSFLGLSLLGTSCGVFSVINTTGSGVVCAF